MYVLSLAKYLRLSVVPALHCSRLAATALPLNRLLETIVVLLRGRSVAKSPTVCAAHAPRPPVTHCQPASARLPSKAAPPIFRLPWSVTRSTTVLELTMAAMIAPLPTLLLTMGAMRAVSISRTVPAREGKLDEEEHSLFLLLFYWHCLEVL